MPNLHLTGGCNCGAVRYEVAEPPLGAAYCHCTRCQRRTGAAASPSASAAPGSFTITQGEDRLKVWAPADGWEKWFCGDCGSAIYSRNPQEPTAIGVRMGTFDGDPGVRPSLRQYVADAAVWEPLPDRSIGDVLAQ